MPRFSPRVVRHLRSLEHAGTLAEQADVYPISVGHAKSGHVLELMVRYQQGVVLMARFRSAGSPQLIAGGELLCQLLETHPLAELVKHDCHFYLEQLQLSVFYKHTAALLVEACNKLHQMVSSSVK